MNVKMANFTTQAKERKDPVETEKVFVANPIVVKWREGCLGVMIRAFGY